MGYKIYTPCSACLHAPSRRCDKLRMDNLKAAILSAGNCTRPNLNSYATSRQKRTVRRHRLEGPFDNAIELSASLLLALGKL